MTALSIRRPQKARNDLATAEDRIGKRLGFWLIQGFRACEDSLTEQVQIVAMLLQELVGALR